MGKSDYFTLVSKSFRTRLKRFHLYLIETGNLIICKGICYKMSYKTIKGTYIVYSVYRGSGHVESWKNVKTKKPKQYRHFSLGFTYGGATSSVICRVSLFVSQRLPTATEPLDLTSETYFKVLGGRSRSYFGRFSE